MGGVHLGVLLPLSDHDGLTNSVLGEALFSQIC